MKERERKQKTSESHAELEEKVLYINRCSKVVKGGRKFSFSALIVVGDGKGSIGFGFAKANEVSDAIRKGTETAKKNIFQFETHGTTIPHEICVDWDGARVMLKPAKPGTGVIAGSKVRAVLELSGVRDIVAKIYGSSNPLNQVRALIKALTSLQNREKVLQARGLTGSAA